MNKTTRFLSLPLLFALLFTCFAYGQEKKDYSQLINNFIERQHPAYLSGNQITLNITDQYFDEIAKVTHVYAQQMIDGIPVHSSVGSFAIQNGEVVYFASSFRKRSNLNQETSFRAVSPILPEAAVERAANQLGLHKLKTPRKLPSTNNNNSYLISKSGVSLNPILVELVYQPVDVNSVRLAWDLSIYTLNGKHLWGVRIDAKTGRIIDKADRVVSCNFPMNPYYNTPNKNETITAAPEFGRAKARMAGDGSKYKVFALPVEAPTFGNRSVVTEPADPDASPYGWHDTNGTAGAEYTITRGNNVYAYLDRDGSETPDYSPDGGSTLDFIFPLDLNQNPVGYQDASATNLFYMNNMMHDIMYHYGFTEEEGNFQVKNYTGKAKGSDPVLARAQQGAAEGPGNNANFGITRDGVSPAMNMYTWGSVVQKLLTINGNGALAGSYYATDAGFGPVYFDVTPLTADLALVQDSNSGSSTDPNDACDPITNGAELNGKIAVIRRGSCAFDSKVSKAQAKGAVGVIVVNNTTGLSTMAGDDPTINIPSIMITKNAGESIINSLKGGNTINVTFDNKSFIKDGSLDNGIVAHEYGHGISSRLTGGPWLTSCLSNSAQMGEGWSDFFALVLTMQSGDQATESRGIGTYALGQETDGLGIRDYPYTTDMSINPMTYESLKEQYYINQTGDTVVTVHGVGTVWATMLWDLTWKLVDRYGFDPDIYHGTGGNNKALKLVIEGLKLQPCRPGFVDGRDAILKADSLLYGGANQCLIWSVFAKRGLGYGADQGSTNNIFDQTASYDMPPNSVLDCSSYGTEDFETRVFQIYPNPATQYVNILSQSVKEDAKVVLFDINGRRVLNREIEGRQTQLDVSGLSTGVYIIKVISRDKVETDKLIIQ